MGLEEEILRDLVQSVTGQRLISALSCAQAQAVIRELEALVAERRRQHRRVGPPSVRANAGQLKYIRDLADRLGWDEWALRSWLKHWFKVEHERWLTNKSAVKAITALKYMRTRQQAKDQPA